MKTFPLIAITAVSVFLSQHGYSQGTDTTVKEALTEGQRDLIRGDMVGAKERFEFVMQHDPENVTAKNYLHTIAIQESSSNSHSELEKTLQKLMISKVELKEATFDTSLEYLKQQADKASDGKTKVNFVVQLPSDVVANTKVTLSLANVPFTEVLHYVSELTGFSFTIDKYAITVKQKSAETPAPAPTTDVPVLPPLNPTTVNGNSSLLDPPSKLQSTGLQSSGLK